MQCGDEDTLQVPIEYIQKSVTIKNMLEDLGFSEGTESLAIPLYNIKKDVLLLVIDYCKMHLEEEERKEEDRRRDLEVSKADEAFIEGLPAAGRPYEKLCELMLAANYLDIKSLLDLACKTLAKKVIGKDPKQLCLEFGVTDPITEKDYEAVKEKYEWAANYTPDFSFDDEK
uniref:SKP1-like protein n=1 Tax=Arcella intermedia TaxID=1963864 RepID=A0A6B2LLI1_9EUKA